MTYPSRFMKSVFIALFITIFGLSGFRDYLTPALYWIVGCLPLLALGILELRLRGLGGLMAAITDNALTKWMGVFWILFIAGIVVAGTVNDIPFWMDTSKYLALALVFLALLAIGIEQKQVVFGLKVWAAIAVCAVGGLYWFEVSNLLVITPGRIAWILAYPGVLWKAGLFLLVWLLWRLLMGPLSVGRMSWLFIAAVIMGFDGSRSGILIAAGAFLFFLLLALVRYKSKMPSVLSRAAIVGLLVILAMGTVNPSPWNPMYQLHQLMPVASTIDSGSAPVVRELAEDSVRLKMLKVALSGSIANFPFGGGFGTTGVPVERVDGLMVVHNTYLQLLSDIGLLGFIGYLGLFLVPVVAVYRRMSRTEDGWKVLDTYALPLGILMCYSVSGMLHPVSSELSEWAIVLLAFCLLVRDRRPPESRRSLSGG
ncbi:hypothetical protein [Marinobacter sp.]|uniref:hypothetical protein n=1 Tax=Marinobacter sp. TaxID=50741 RepID=UPI003A9368BA